MQIINSNSEDYLMNKATFIQSFDNQKYKGDSLSLLNTGCARKLGMKSVLSQGPNLSSLRQSSINFRSGVNSFLQPATYSDAVHKLKLANKSSATSLLQLCKSIDQHHTGYLTNLEFRKILKQLPVTSQEIDLVMRGSLGSEGMLKYEDVCKQLNPNQMDGMIQDRTKSRLRKLKDNIYDYMLSPKDAFRQFDSLRQGRLTFDQFNEFIVKLHQLSGQQIPPFSVIKDLFDFIDIRNDGIIDIHEWMQTFRSLEQEKFIQLGKKQVQSPSSHSVSQQTAYRALLNCSGNTKNKGNESDWQLTPLFDKVLMILNKNHRSLNELFQTEANDASFIPLEKAKNILKLILNPYAIYLNDNELNKFVQFALKDDYVNYKFFLEIMKYRGKSLQLHPNLKFNNEF